MRPAITVLQLDTGFPRIPGDVACPDTYLGAAELLIVPGATVRRIVSDRPDLIDIAPFEAALARARGEVIATSCGFLSYWQDHLARRTKMPVIASALTALPRLARDHAPGEILILTFDAARLNRLHLGAQGDHMAGLVGLPPQMHLRQVIEDNRATLDPNLATRELVDFVTGCQRPGHRHILLECTNLPPYAAALQRATGLPVSSILTEVEAMRPGTVAPKYLPGRVAS
ncbi:hypothetical protein [Jannaschia pohangensis]|uniref:Aspartate/glutamate racemase family protein n=1 Tax=Jannaschia pohangensis TaxID=390807 RepID=A0A1I3HDD8_9RHOB|nr:hypothetical protein [Jannaschia pohangensis]SFI33756.1 hypothetical protein SAMN04488095_0550 [Jannaschia pohangensis]